MSLKTRIIATIGATSLAAAATIVAKHEGTVLRTYPDPVLKWKVPTACTGHTGPELRPGQTFTREECAVILQGDIAKTGAALAPCLADGLSEQEVASYIVLAFNVGPSAVCKSSISAKLARGDRAAACATISDFYMAGGKDCRIRSNNCYGIVNYRLAARELCESGL